MMFISVLPENCMLHIRWRILEFSQSNFLHLLLGCCHMSHQQTQHYHESLGYILQKDLFLVMSETWNIEHLIEFRQSIQSDSCCYCVCGACINLLSTNANIPQSSFGESFRGKTTSRYLIQMTWHCIILTAHQQFCVHN